ncbi:MAG: pentapeptide repeat-containing protein [Fibrobacteres bacterium]|nr:pentapeptide repeat-containing protein [Fibrobacterota bacterium]
MSNSVNMIRQKLNQPADFQELYGNTPQRLDGETLPADSWRGLRLVGWTFRDVSMERTRFDHVLFEKCTLSEVVMDRAEFKNCQFKDCLIERIAIHGGSWKGNRFEGGRIVDLSQGPNPRDNSPLEWVDDTFQSVEIAGWSGDEHPVTWTRPVFLKSTLHQSDLSAFQMVSPRFEDCQFSENTWNEPSGGEIEDGQFLHCSFRSNRLLHASWDAHIADSRFAEPQGTPRATSAENLEIEGSHGPVHLHGARQVKITGTASSASLEETSDLELDDVQGYGISLQGNSDRVHLKKAKVEDLTFYSGHFQDCVFQNLETVALSFWDAEFERCRFENILVSQKLSFFASPRFQQCSFANVRLSPAAKLDDPDGHAPTPLPWSIPR